MPDEKRTVARSLQCSCGATLVLMAEGGEAETKELVDVVHRRFEEQHPEPEHKIRERGTPR